MGPFKSELAERLHITSDKHLTRYLGIDILRTEYGPVLSQQRLAGAIFEKAKGYIDKCKVSQSDVPIKLARPKNLKAPTVLINSGSSKIMISKDQSSSSSY